MQPHLSLIRWKLKIEKIKLHQKIPGVMNDLLASLMDMEAMKHFLIS